MINLKKHFNRLKEANYQHRQYVILSAVLGFLVLAFAFNRFILNRSVILLTITEPNVDVTVDGEHSTLQKISDNTYKVVTIPGRHTVTIKAGGAVNHQEIIQTKAGRTTAVTPALSIAPNPTSNTVGQVKFLAESTDRDYLYYLGESGQALVRYQPSTGEKIALSDPAFRNIINLSWSSDFSSVVVQNSKNNWYSFDFHKSDFVTPEFVPIADPTYLSIQHDPVGSNNINNNIDIDKSHHRVGFIEYRDNAPVFGVASTGLDNQHVLTVLSDLHDPSFIWNNSGLNIALIEDARYTKSNLEIYDLAQDTLTVVPGVSSVSRASFSPDGRNLLIEHGDSGLDLAIYDLANNHTTNLGTLASLGAAVWRADNQTITALINQNSTPALVDLNLSSTVTNTYTNTPHLTGDLDAMYLDKDETMLLFSQNNTLYTFPLIKQNN